MGKCPERRPNILILIQESADSRPCTARGPSINRSMDFVNRQGRRLVVAMLTFRYLLKQHTCTVPYSVANTQYSSKHIVNIQRNGCQCSLLKSLDQPYMYVKGLFDGLVQNYVTTSFYIRSYNSFAPSPRYAPQRNLNVFQFLCGYITFCQLSL